MRQSQQFGQAFAPAIVTAYNDPTGGLKTLNLNGYLTVIGACGSAQQSPASKLVAFFNNTTSVHFVAFGTTSSVAVPTGPANGIPIPPNSYMYLSTGPNNYFISDSSSVFAYAITDSTTYTG